MTKFKCQTGQTGFEFKLPIMVFNPKRIFNVHHANLIMKTQNSIFRQNRRRYSPQLPLHRHHLYETSRKYSTQWETRNERAEVLREQQVLNRYPGYITHNLSGIHLSIALHHPTTCLFIHRWSNLHFTTRFLNLQKVYRFSIQPPK